VVRPIRAPLSHQAQLAATNCRLQTHTSVVRIETVLDWCYMMQQEAEGW